MRCTSDMPPACERSGWATATPAASAGRNSARPYSRSPVATGTGLDAISPASRCPCSGSSGSSTNSGCSGASSDRTRRAPAGLKRPWKSTATSRCGPRTARAAATRSITAAVSAGLVIGDVRPAAFIFTAVKPASTCAVTSSVSRAGSSPPTHAYTRTRSLTGPPSRACAGAPYVLPAMSHSAWSIPATALESTGPPR